MKLRISWSALRFEQDTYHGDALPTDALVFGYFGALEQWYLDGGVQPIAKYVEEGMLPLRSIWSTPDESDST